MLIYHEKPKVYSLEELIELMDDIGLTWVYRPAISKFDGNKYPMAPKIPLPYP